MGLANSPTAFQRLMENVFQGISGKTVYVDDIPVFSETWEQHLKTLRQIFDRLKDSGLKVKFAKCVWAAAECRVVGSIVSKEGTRPDPETVSAIHQLPVPRNVADIRSFLGATGHFHEHIEYYAAKSAPVRALLKRNATFLWDDDCQQAFERLLLLWATWPILLLVRS